MLGSNVGGQLAHFDDYQLAILLTREWIIVRPRPAYLFFRVEKLDLTKYLSVGMK